MTSANKYFYLQLNDKYLTIEPEQFKISYTNDKKLASVWYCIKQKKEEYEHELYKIQDTVYHTHLGAVHYPLRYITRLESLFHIEADIVHPVTTYWHIPGYVNIHKDKPLKIIENI